MSIVASTLDFREAARRRLPHFLFEYIDGGSYGEVTLKRNTADLERIALRQRVLRDISALDLSTELFGQKLALPVALAPIGLAGMNARRGEVQAARAAEVKRLLAAKPKAKGLAAPGMPLGSPGMEGPRKDAYDVLLVMPDGSSRVYQHYN